MNKRTLQFLSGLIVIIAAGLAYWFYLAPPGGFPDKEEVSGTMLGSYPNIHIAEIQDIIFLDDEHVFAPFITKEEGHGISLWNWKQHEWQLEGYSIGSMPYIWKISPDEPSTYKLLWNFHPGNDLDYLTFYMVKERGYSISDGIHHYQPGIQMDFESDAETKSYGYSSIPKEWQEFISADNKQMESLIQDTLFSNLYPPAQYYFGWSSTAKDGSVEYPSYPDDSGSGSGGSSIEYLRFLTKDEVYEKSGK